MTRHRRPAGFQRTDRIGDHIQRELARLLREALKDPRVGNVTVQEVRVSKDLSYADVYVTVLGQNAEQAQQSVEALRHASGFLRTELAQVMNTRTTPKLRFHYDDLPERASDISALIARALAGDAAANQQLSEPDDSDP